MMAAFAVLRDGVPFAASSILYSVADSAVFPSWHDDANSKQ